MNKIHILLSFVFISFVFLNGRTFDIRSKPSSTTNVDTSYFGTKIPEINLTSLNGTLIDSAYFSKKIVFITFWFNSCAPCIGEIPVLNQLYDEYSNNVNFISISFDDKKTLKKAAKKYKFEFLLISTTKEVITETGLVNDGYPTSIIVKDNIIKYKISGGPITSSKVYQKVLKQDYSTFKRELDKLIE